MSLRRDPAKTRAWKERSKPLAKGAPPERRTRIQPVNRDRKAKLFEQQFHSSAYVEFVHAQPCAVPGCSDRRIQCAHVVHTRAAGGRWYHIAPLCAPHHRAQEGNTKAFEAEHGVDLRDVAAEIACRWKVEQEGHT